MATQTKNTARQLGASNTSNGLADLTHSLPLNYQQVALIVSKSTNTGAKNPEDEIKNKDYYKDITSEKQTKENPTHSSKTINRPSQSKPKNSIVIVDLDDNAGGYRAIQLSFVPKELKVEIDNQLNSIGGIGRSHPFYQFSGSEESIDFEIDWYSTDINRQDVISKCRWLSSISRNDFSSRGKITSPPHRIKLIWGSNNFLFEDYIWIIEKAPYDLSQFANATIDGSGNVKNSNLLPVQAYQKVTLKRLTKLNIGHYQIDNKYANRWVI
jgi:hypothetical protein